MHNSKLTSLLGACAVTVAGIGVAQQSKTPRPKALPPIEGKSLGLKGYVGGVNPGGYFHWTVIPWVADDAQFVAIRQHIDAMIAGGKKRSALLAAYKRAAQENPTDATAQFAWAYAAFRNYSKLEPGQSAASVVEGVTEGLEQPRVTKSYEYARMRWFFLQWNDRFRVLEQPILSALARRLLQRNPNDFDLKYTFAYSLAEEFKTSNEARGYATQYLQKFPSRPPAYYLMGHVYESSFGLWQRKQDALTAQGYYRKFLAKAAPSNSSRSAAQWHINDLTQRIATFEKAGILKP